MRTGLVLAAWLMAAPAAGRTVTVGAGGLPTLAAAVRVAQDGDTIHLGPGEWFECAVLTQRDLVLEGAGPGTILTDRPCEGKAALVVRGANLTVRDLVLARSRVPDMNGAGIRLEAQGLTVERVRFVNDQVGLLAAQGGPGRIRIADCVFERGGVAGDHPTAALMVGDVALLEVERSTFTGVKGDQIRTEAAHTALAGNRIEVGAEPGAMAVMASGSLSMRDNVLVLGPHPAARGAAVLAMGGAVELRGNRMENGTGAPARLLLDWAGASPVLEDNTVGPGDTVVSSDGYWRHEASDVAHEVIGDVRGLAGAAKRAARGLLTR